MSTVTFVNPVTPVKTWLRALNLSGVGARVYIGAPERATKPYVEIWPIDARLDGSDTPLAHPRIQITVQGDVGHETPHNVAWAIVSAVESIAGGTRFDSTLVCHGGRLVLGPIPRADEAGPRVVMDFEFSVVAQ